MDLRQYIDSGILEQYVLGQTSDQENVEIAALAYGYPEVAAEIEAISIALQKVAESEAIAPPPDIEATLFAEIDALAAAEGAETPRVLDASSSARDYERWIHQPGLQPPDSYENIYFDIFHENETGITAMVWMKEGSPPEIHHTEIEKFLILEGTCEIKIADTVHYLKAGDFLSIPLHVTHSVKVTSDIPCKILLQRIAA